MRFAKHRALIFVSLVMVPLSAGLAVLQTPVMSDLLLGVSLRYARFRTGIPVEASGWRVNPFTFSASLDDLRIRHEQLVFHASEVWVQLSPLSLLFGDINLRDLSVQSPSLRGRIPKSWLEPGPESSGADTTEAPWSRDPPTWLGRRLAAIFGELEKRNLLFDEASIRGLSVDAAPFAMRKLDLEVSNLELGQARLRWSAEAFSWQGGIGHIESFAGSLSLLRESPTTFYTTIGGVRLSLRAGESPDLMVDGRFPGQIQIAVSSRGEDIHRWLAASPKLVDARTLERLEGDIWVQARLQTKKGGLISASGKADLARVRYGGHVLKALSTDFDGDSSATRLRNLVVSLPAFPGDQVSTGGTIRSNEVVIDGKRVQGLLELDRASICSIQLAADSTDCYSAVSVNGTIVVEGTLDPFELRASIKSKLAGVSFISGDSLYQARSPEPLTLLEPTDFSAQVLVRDKYLIIEPGDLTRPDGMLIRTEGRIDYKPTVVDLRVNATQLPLGRFAKQIIGLDWDGLASAKGRVQYSMLIPQETGRTKVDFQMEIKDLGFEGQALGDATGPFAFSGDSFRIGPVLLRSGGGFATLSGRIQIPADAPSRMTLTSRFSRLELVSRLPDSGQEAFRGLVSGQAELSGGLRATEEKSFLAGPIALTFDAARIFGIPFEAGGVRAHYKERVLQVSQAKAIRGRAVVSVQGLLHPDKGSELSFRSDDFALRDTELHPFFQSLQSGRTSFQGIWRPADGWSVEGRTREVKVAGESLPDGTFRVGGKPDSFGLRVELPGAANVAYEELGSDPKNTRSTLKGSLQDLGIYAVLAYLKEWTTPSRVRPLGRVEFDLSSERGELRLGPLEIRGPVGLEGREALLVKLPPDQTISWEGNRARRVALESSKPEAWALRASPGDSAIRVEGRLPATLVDLFVPVIGLRDGVLEIRGRLPLPPDLQTAELQGSLENGVVSIEALGAPATGASARLALEKSRLQIDEFTGKMGPGEVQVSGAYKIDADKPGLALRARFNRARAVLMRDLPFEASGEILMSGEGRPYSLSGEVLVQNGLYSREFGFEEAESAVVRDPFFKLNVGIEIGGKFAVRNSLLNTELTGRLLASGSDVSPILRGKIDLQPNGILYARDNEFRIARGNVVFTGAEGNVPVVSLEANSTIKADRDYRVQLGVSGPTDRLDFAFSSDPALPTQDIVMLLAFGFTRPEETADAGGEDGLFRNAQWQALQLLFGQALGKNLDKTTGFQVRVQNQQSSNTQSGRTMVPKVTVHRKLTDRISTVYGKALDGSKEQDLQVDYRLFKNMNISGVWEEPEPTKSSLGVDLRFKFDIK